jgi:hypothetical protein
MPAKHEFSATWSQPLPDKACNESSIFHIRFCSSYNVKYYFQR